MNILIIILVVIAILIATLLFVALFIKKEYTIEREITINKPKREVFNYVRFIKNQDYYSKWVMMDPDMKKDFRGTDGTEGFVYAWDGNKKAGKGEQEIKRITEGERIDLEVRFIRPFEAIAKTPMTIESISSANSPDGYGNDQTKVKWGMEGKSKYPLNLMNPFMNDMLGKDLEASLTNLKNILEKK